MVSLIGSFDKMDAVEGALSEQKPLESVQNGTPSPESNALSNPDMEKELETVAETGEQAPTGSQEKELAEDEKAQKQVDYLDENGDLKLELPDTLEHEDFSKLLEFDEKNDHDIFESHDIYQHTMGEAHSDSHHEIEDLNSNLSRQMSLNGGEEAHGDEDSSDNDGSSKLEIHDDMGLSESMDPKSDTADQNVDDMRIKEETLSPKRTLQPLNHQKALSEQDAFTNDKESEDVPEADDNLKLENGPTAAHILENVHFSQVKRHDSLTPIMFQQHELPPNGVNDNQQQIPREGPNRDGLSLADEQPTISAYARLDFQSFTFYVQTLHVIIGRRSENDFSHKVDVNLGPSKSISRRHAQIFYNFGTGRFEVSIIGKNGAFVDDIFVERGNTVPLRNKTKVQIGQVPFQFVLPEQEKGEQIQKTPEIPEPSEVQEPVSPVKSEEKLPRTTAQPVEKKQPKKAAPKKEKKPAKAPKKVYTLEEIPEEYRTKPTCSYSALLTTCIRKYSSPKGMSLSEIYAGIRELFPYYKYCPDGWQSSVRHNLSLNKSFRKVSKEGKGWLWGLDEEYIAERERLKKKQAEAAAAKAAASQQRLEQQQQQRAKKAYSPGSNSMVNKVDTSSRASSGKQQSISQTLAANRAADKKNGADDYQRTMKYLQEQLMILTKDRKGLSKQVFASILTQALAMTINQVSQAAKSKGITGNPLTALMNKNPQHLNLILAAAVNAATSKVTNGKVKQLVDISLMAKQAAKPPPPSVTVRKTTPAYNSSSGGMSSSGAKPPEGSFDPTSLSRFFQPRQPTRVATPPTMTPTIPTKRSFDKSDESSSDEETSSSDDEDDDSDDSDDTDDNNDEEEDEEDEEDANGEDSEEGVQEKKDNEEQIEEAAGSDQGTADSRE